MASDFQENGARVGYIDIKHSLIKRLVQAQNDHSEHRGGTYDEVFESPAFVF